MKVKFKLPYDEHDVASDATGLKCEDASLTVQSMSVDADINEIVRRFGLTGELPTAGSVPLVTNGEFVESMTYQDAMNIVVAGRESFDKMPWQVRKRFDYDPARFVDFCSDVEKNREELEKLGLAVPKAPVVDPVVPEAPKA